MAKEVVSKSTDNSFGVASVVLGIFSIVFASINGIILGIIALVFANKQQTRNQNKWSKNGKILAIVGIILSILVIIISFYYYKTFGGLIPTPNLPQ